MKYHQNKYKYIIQSTRYYQVPDLYLLAVPGDQVSYHTNGMIQSMNLDQNVKKILSMLHKLATLEVASGANDGNGNGNGNGNDIATPTTATPSDNTKQEQQKKHVHQATAMPTNGNTKRRQHQVMARPSDGKTK